ncbi:poly(3-hydroxyalkanoate) depolymerase [Tsukamurella spumae]|uniref:Poly(3-hydroxyalkanoate) depolymerase n=1 Tax=Tsukamurella spumae TaxID=44753 RepID=A0A846WYD4_9ACTN|nr:poly(3-hydroxyalkanoate) depolymerase [Tsukamurella spumae]NKY17944.1 poly(3-hydroxyalkanoate) depolymerase [Tsukamurella spumae]
MSDNTSDTSKSAEGSEVELPEDLLIATGGQRIRVRHRPGTGVPLVLCNGIGASLEVLDPFVEALDPERPVVRFDAPGTGESPTSLLPYGFPYLAWIVGRVLDELGIGVVDVLGLSWGGALAQQFAFQNPMRCRRLILVSTGTGAIMVPGNPRVLSKMVTPKRFRDPAYAAQVAGELYGGSVREDSADIGETFSRQMHAGSKMGYLHQLMAGSVWTSIFALPVIRQKTLLVFGEDDPIIPMINGRIFELLLPRATLYRHDGGHVDLVTRPQKLAREVEDFLGTPHLGRRQWRRRTGLLTARD